MMNADDITTALDAIQAEMCKMLAAEESPYDGGRNIWGIAMSHSSTSPEVMHPLWLIWGALTDWVENKPDEKAQAEKEMLRAAREWLSLEPKDSSTMVVYLERWVYDEMGYERKEKA